MACTSGYCVSDGLDLPLQPCAFCDQETHVGCGKLVCQSCSIENLRLNGAPKPLGIDGHWCTEHVSILELTWKWKL